MRYLDFEVTAHGTAVALVTLDHRANVKLLDAPNYGKYKRGEAHRYRGGWATRSPYRIPIPHRGTWHVTVDLGASGGTVNASLRVLP